MSGTSLDGLDIVLVEFDGHESIQYRLIATQHIPYEVGWKNQLEAAFCLDESKLLQLDLSYGDWLGWQVRNFLDQHQESADLIGSHGHTIFHQPDQGISLQIGNGAMIAQRTGIPVVCNFRKQDVLKGGQGAPLVPIGDAMLFPAYHFCLNLGGISNASWDEQGCRRACDLSVCNMLLNALSRRLQLEYDPQGENARKGQVLPDVLATWNAIPFYNKPAPKSLGREWYAEHFERFVADSNLDTHDLMCTAVEHIAFQIDRFLKSVWSSCAPTSVSNASVLCTGGGSYHAFLVERLNTLGEGTLRYVIPEKSLVDFKEALVFALLAYLRRHQRINVLKSVTGAMEDHSSGDVFGRPEARC